MQSIGFPRPRGDRPDGDSVRGKERTAAGTDEEFEEAYRNEAACPICLRTLDESRLRQATKDLEKTIQEMERAIGPFDLELRGLMVSVGRYRYPCVQQGCCS